MSLLLRETLRIATTMLEDAGVCDAEHDAKELYMFQAGLDRVGLMMHWTDVLHDNVVDRYMELVEERAKRVPLQHITGTQEFMGINFTVNDKVLIPRQDTEVLVEKALDLMKDKGGDVLDLCTGSGAIAVSIAKLEKNAKVTATDISKEALAVAEKNAKDNGVKIKFIESDMFNELKGAFGEKKFNFIISNPPYISRAEIDTLEIEVKEHEPMAALLGGEDGLDFYRIIASEAPKHLKKDGMLLMEIGYDQGESVPKLLEDTEMFTDIEVIKDLAGLNRVVVSRLKGKVKK